MNQVIHDPPKKLRILLISSIRPELSSAGQIVLHRHLCNEQEIELEVHDYEPPVWTLNGILRRIVGRLSQVGLKRISEDCWALWGGKWLDKSLSKVSVDDGTIVLTVAQGDVFPAAVRLAKRHGLSLVSIFHDWWPDMTGIHAPFRRLLDKRYRNLYKESNLALCVSEGMRSHLGKHPHAVVLYPIPAKKSLPPSSPKPSCNLKVLYFGNLHEYGPMLAEALGELGTCPLVRLETRGANPNWPESFRLDMESEGLWHDFSSREILEEWINSADAFLVPMVFDPALRRRMETSFPSKMVEMALLGKPLVVWGPEYCSAIQWARKGKRALCVTDPDPKILRQEIENLALDPGEINRLSAAARDAAAMEFSPERIHTQFINALKEVAGIE